MHPDDVATDEDLVCRLVAAQFPSWADLPVERLAQRGTDNALYRLGEDMVVRLPRRARPALTLEKELRWLPVLEPQLPLPIPVPLARGKAADGYPFPWAVYGWLPGSPAMSDSVQDLVRLASDLARFLSALRRIDTRSAPAPGEHNFYRGVPLAQRDAATRDAIERLTGEIDADAATAAWENALRTPEWRQPAVWIHGDLDAHNLLAAEGRLSGVVDFGGLAVGDPACDAMVAWKVLDADAREVFRSALAVDEATWARGRGWALSQALVALASYAPETHPTLVGEARRWLAELL